MTENNKIERFAAEQAQALAVMNFTTKLAVDDKHTAEETRRHEHQFFNTLASQLAVKSGLLSPEAILLEPARISVISNRTFMVFRSDLNPHRGVAVAISGHYRGETSVGLMFLGKDLERQFTATVGDDALYLAEVIVEYFKTKEISESFVARASEQVSEVEPVRQPDPANILVSPPDFIAAEELRNTRTLKLPGEEPAAVPVHVRTRITEIDIAFATQLHRRLVEKRIEFDGKADIDYSLSLGPDAVGIHFLDNETPAGKEIMIAMRVTGYPANPTYSVQAHKAAWNVSFKDLPKRLDEIAFDILASLYDSEQGTEGVYHESYEIDELCLTHRLASINGRRTVTNLAYSGQYGAEALRDLEERTSKKILLGYISKAMKEASPLADSYDVFERIFSNPIAEG